jgi:acetylornithine aminotransferase/acetylornithine/N-succinyldiaminopimelate aminotransferase
MVEIIQGEGGVRIGKEEFIRGLRDLCNKEGLLLIIDEVQTGIGRTGKMFAYEHYGVKPDILTLAKGLGGGVPIGVMIAKKDVADLLSPGTHASTFGGNFLATASALTVLDVIQKEGLVEKAEELGGYFLSRLNRLREKYPSLIKEVRGKGLMVGVELLREGNDIVERCLSKGLLINCIMDSVLRFLPPLVVKKKEIDKATKILDEVFGEVLNEKKSHLST